MKLDSIVETESEKIQEEVPNTCPDKPGICGVCRCKDSFVEVKGLLVCNVCDSEYVVVE